MKTCKICGGPKSNYVLNNRTVCMKCDELVFDVEEIDALPIANHPS